MCASHGQAAPPHSARQILKVLLSITFVMHVQTCIWYAVGEADQVLPNGELVQGWVALQPWEPEENGTGVIGVPDRYLGSLWSVMNMAENGTTSLERTVCVFFALVLGFIYGTLAGVLAATMFGQYEKQEQIKRKILTLRKWLSKQRAEDGKLMFTRKYKRVLLKHFVRVWTQPYLVCCRIRK